VEAKPETKPLRWSRRSVLVAVGLTPAVLFSLKVSATDHEQIDAWAKDPDNHVHPDDQAKFVLACGHLWNAVVHAMGGPQMMDDQAAVLRAALDKSAKKIRDKLIRFPANGYDDKTMSCAAICGYLCAQEAGQKKVTSDMFNCAWRETHDYMESVVARADTGASTAGGTSTGVGGTAGGTRDFGLAC
jgi:hypothetical protein